MTSDEWDKMEQGLTTDEWDRMLDELEEENLLVDKQARGLFGGRYRQARLQHCLIYRQCTSPTRQVYRIVRSYWR